MRRRDRCVALYHPAGRSGIGRWLLGSVADKVLRSATAPVLVVPVTPAESGQLS